MAVAVIIRIIRAKMEIIAILMTRANFLSRDLAGGA